MQRIRHAPRELRPNEREVLQWLFEHRKTEAGDVQVAVEAVKVIGGCPCGCPTLDFVAEDTHDEKGTIVSDVFGLSPEGVPCWVTLWASGTELAGIEITAFAHEGSFSLPEARNLRSPDDWSNPETTFENGTVRVKEWSGTLS